MRKYLWRKGIVIGIIVLFVGDLEHLHERALTESIKEEIQKHKELDI